MDSFESSSGATGSLELLSGASHALSLVREVLCRACPSTVEARAGLKGRRGLTVEGGSRRSRRCRTGAVNLA